MVSCRKNRKSIKNTTACNANAALHPDVRRTMQTSPVATHVRKNNKEMRAKIKEVVEILLSWLCCFQCSTLAGETSDRDTADQKQSQGTYCGDAGYQITAS